jgi:hypothetical protein
MSRPVPGSGGGTRATASARRCAPRCSRSRSTTSAPPAARSGAFLDNPASLRVSEKLGYRRDGIDVHARRGERAENIRLLLTPATFHRPAWTLEVEGVEACLPMLGVTPG